MKALIEHSVKKGVTTMTLKKFVALMFCLILVTVQISALAAGSEPNVFYATFSVNLHYNRQLSTYGVTVYLDGVKVAHLDRGDVTTFGAFMTDDRTHELRFDADKQGVPDRVWTISNLQNGSVLTCEIQSKRNQVKIRTYDMSVDSNSIISITPDIEREVRIAGTLIRTVIGGLMGK